MRKWVPLMLIVLWYWGVGAEAAQKDLFPLLSVLSAELGLQGGSLQDTRMTSLVCRPALCSLQDTWDDIIGLWSSPL